MGLFGWHNCGVEGCDAVLFVPTFDAPSPSRPEGPMWAEYERERGRWHVGRTNADTRCPEHREGGKT
jgi:hypothetical protein